MKYGKIENNIVVQVQPNQEEGFVEIADNVEAQMEQKADGSFDFPQSHYDAIQAEKDRLEQVKTTRASAKAKLISGEALTEEEADSITA
tara:strand:- start:295 stop:561 length:267 start_codon:yes stop_codon:yes gene_type:complete